MLLLLLLSDVDGAEGDVEGATALEGEDGTLTNVGDEDDALPPPPPLIPPSGGNLEEVIDFLPPCAIRCRDSLSSLYNFFFVQVSSSASFTQSHLTI